MCFPFLNSIDLTKVAAGLSALLTPVVAIITVIVLVLQYLLAARSWRLAAYDKRYPVFTEILDYILFVHRNAAMTFERLAQFKNEARNKEFLFGKEIRIFVRQLYEKGADLYANTETMKFSQEGPDEDFRKAMILESAELKKWFIDQDDVAKNLFGRYLRIK